MSRLIPRNEVFPSLRRCFRYVGEEDRRGEKFPSGEHKKHAFHTISDIYMYLDDRTGELQMLAIFY
jgi:hypothetical protein